MHGDHPDIPYVAVAPFVVILLGIAILPLVAGHWWEKNRNRLIFTAIVTVPTGAYLVTLNWHMLLHAAEEYFSFIFLLGSLFIISGGIVLRGELKQSPWVNAGLLATGAVLASVIGTTGASMLLIRPYLRANRVRDYSRHLPIFFIFVVSNAGGLLTPLGDPPLFLGFLRGVPFTWTFHLVPEWAFVNGILILIFLVVELRLAAASGAPADYQRTPPSLAGAHNFIFLGMVVASAALLPLGWRELGMGVATVLSMVTTKKTLREENGFTFHPIEEVAILFAGIFVTMQPALGLLQAHGPEMGLNSPHSFFWVTGALSSFLDNAPTYVTFFTVAQSLGGENLVAQTGVPEAMLVAISLGAVFMGANTYIGNGPNFMVKSICDEAGFTTPSFFGYMLWSVGILVPLLFLVSVLFI
ncbi:MAG: sodium:proton antiporter [Deltaproteobacteria bacterium]|nr:sodium:proton antiporter [Deltaproteobacteria bacterium]